RSCEALLGICQGLLADNQLNEKEFQFLSVWLKDNPEIASLWPGSAIAHRVSSMLSDGVVTADELEDLKRVLVRLIGGTLEQTGAAGGISTALPIDQFISVDLPGRVFCFTGKFLYGARSACSKIVVLYGGCCIDTVTKDLDFLVIGTLVSPDWMYSTHGR